MNNFIFENATKVYFGKGCVKELDLCQYFGQKKLKDYAAFLVPHPPFAEVSYNQ